MSRRNSKILKSFCRGRTNIDLHIQLKLMHSVGLLEDRSLCCSKFYGFYTLFVFVISAFHLLTMIIILPEYVCDISKAGIIMSIILSYIEVIFKIVVVLIFREKIDRLVTTMLKDFSCVEVIENEIQQQIIKQSLKLTRKVCFVFLFLTLSACTIWCLEPIVYKVMHTITSREKTLHKGAMLPFTAWYPFDTTTTPAYEIIYVYQVVVGYLGTLITCATDLLFVSLMIYTATHLQMLGNYLKKIRLQKHFQFMKFEGNSENQYPLSIVEVKRRYDKEQDVHTQFQLVQCIKHHNSIIKFAQELEEVISPVMFFQFIATALEICFAGFQAKQVSDWGPNFLKCVMYTLANILQTFCYCRFGEGIIAESDNFALAVYNSQWYEESPTFKITVKMLLMRSQKPLKLVAGKFYTVSLQSFARLLNMSYSFLTILQQVHE